jgi:glucosamine--fructose-6-phosphate aminotransferase (isomerizing)
LPEKIEAAWEADWSPVLDVLGGAQDMYVVARGHGLATAQEAALKLKETCRLHAEAYSGAEVLHGPMALLRPAFPVLLFAQGDETLESMRTLAARMTAQGASVISAGLAAGVGMELPLIPADPLTAPILEIASFYRLANALALARGFDPDRPPHLAKITETR